MVQFKSKVDQNVFLQIFILQRQSKLDEVTGRTGEADGLVGILATQPPLTTPLERRDIPPQLRMTLELIVGKLDVLAHFWRANISEQGSIVETKSLGDGLRYTPVDDPIMLPHIEEVEGTHVRGKEAKEFVPFKSLHI